MCFFPLSRSKSDPMNLRNNNNNNINVVDNNIIIRIYIILSSRDYCDFYCPLSDNHVIIMRKSDAAETRVCILDLTPTCKCVYIVLYTHVTIYHIAESDLVPSKSGISLPNDHFETPIFGYSTIYHQLCIEVYCRKVN